MYFLAVGHLRREISRGTKVTASLTPMNFRRSPLLQGGLEIACKVTVKMPAMIKCHMILDRFKELVKDYYTEPTNEEILVLSWQSLCMILQDEHKNLRHFKEKNPGQIQTLEICSVAKQKMANETNERTATKLL